MDLHQELVDTLLPPLLNSFLLVSYPSNKFMYHIPINKYKSKYQVFLA